jgi:Fe-S cluster assembly iron-binding protein IscA
MVIAYKINTNKFDNYIQLQKFRTLIQKISLSYFANHLGLSKSYLHQYKKNIEEIDTFIKEKSNIFLNDPIAGKYFSNIIVDWNFYRSNLLHKTLQTPKTVYILSTSIDYKLTKIKENYIENLNDTF